MNAGEILMRALEAINKYLEGDRGVLKKEKWLMFLALTDQKNINLEKIESLDEMDRHYSLRYVKRSLEVLEKYRAVLSEAQFKLVEDVLKWSEVSKAGMSHHREAWKKKGYALHIHNYASADIYRDAQTEDTEPYTQIVRQLIVHHGTIGQYIRGEVKRKDIDLKPIFHEVEKAGLGMDLHAFTEAMKVLNHAIIEASSKAIWESIKEDVYREIDDILLGSELKEPPLKERLRRLRKASIAHGEDFDAEYEKVAGHSVEKALSGLLDHAHTLWYVEAALSDFTLEEFIKILLFIANEAEGLEGVNHISFEKLMVDLYYQYKGKKRVNVYKKRIIEKYLSEQSIEDILSKKIKTNVHIKHQLNREHDTGHFVFLLSPAAQKLVEFGVEAEKSNIVYEKATVMLYDFFELRKDHYDRFNNEEKYLETMNKAIDYKKVILDYIKGHTVIDIGPGGGALMDLIESRYPEKKIMGVDISQNVIDALKRRKQLEKKSWDVKYSDALNLGEYFDKSQADTIIYCSILHEIYSYIEYEGRKFNFDTLKKALKSAFDILSVGGRIIIRDGIMTEPKEQYRRIKFLSSEGMEFLQRYVKDFKGREITYSVVGQNEVLMKINDAMEFLYTYTWGEDSYAHEVQEQFGYFTPSEYLAFIKDTLGDSAKVIELRHYLQEGYTLELAKKIEFFDEHRNKVNLPDSTCLIVIEKIKDV